MPPHRNLGVQKTRRRWVRRFVVLLLVLALAAVAVFAFMLYQPFHGKGYDAVVVRIPPGSSAGDIGDLLAAKGVVELGLLLRPARAAGRRPRQAARRHVHAEAGRCPTSDALAALTEAPTAAPTIDVTLPEGPSRRELAPRVAQAGRARQLRQGQRALDACCSPRTLRRAEGRPGRSRASCSPTPTSCAAGPRPPSSSSTSSCAAFKREFAKVDLKRARRKNLSRYDVLIIASMIEREAAGAQGPPADLGGHLQPPAAGHPARHRRDAALRLNNWTQAAARVRAATSTPPTTRAGASGLPPTPIGNPGLASIRAAANPANVDVPLLRRQAVRQRRPRVLARPTRSSRRTSPPTTARATSAAARTPRTADREPTRRIRS